jgi:hypothetical protein
MRTVIFVLGIALASVSCAIGEQQGVIFFGQHDMGCRGGTNMTCGIVAVNILDLEAKQQLSCRAVNPSVNWVPGSNPFRIRAKNLNVTCWRFRTTNLPSAATSSWAFAQENDYSKYRASGDSPAAFVWIYDKASKSVTLCASDGDPNSGWMEAACEQAKIEDAT